MTGDLIDIELRQVMRDVNARMGDDYVRIDRRPFMQYRKLTKVERITNDFVGLVEEWSPWQDVSTVEEE